MSPNDLHLDNLHQDLMAISDDSFLAAGNLTIIYLLDAQWVVSPPYRHPAETWLDVPLPDKEMPPLVQACSAHEAAHVEHETAHVELKRTAAQPQIAG